jgi:hypothetical protein
MAVVSQRGAAVKMSSVMRASLRRVACFIYMAVGKYRLEVSLQNRPGTRTGPLNVHDLHKLIFLSEGYDTLCFRDSRRL